MLTAALTLEPVQRLEHRASPELLAYAELLALPMGELEAIVDREVEQNPALERRDPPACPACGVAGSPCLCNPRRGRAVGSDLRPVDLPLADEPTTAQALLDDVRPLVAPLDQPILAYVIGCLDGRGFADMSAGEIARELGVPVGRVETVLAVLREHGPAGIGAVDLRECLLLQLDRLEAAGQGHPLVRRIVDRHLHLLARGQWRMLACALDVSRAEVLAATDFIRTRLRPDAPVDVPLRVEDAAVPAVPDVIVREAAGQAGTFSVEIVERRRVSLGLGPDYRPDRVTLLRDAERQWVELYARRAEGFIGRLERRWETMRAVAEAVVARQRNYLLHGPLQIKPLTRAEVAAEIGMHESTVSRAVRGRHVLLPSGRLTPFAAFFDGAQGPCAALARLVAQEQRPSSDAELALALTHLGFPVARRTVAKYRDRLGIPRHTDR